MVGAEINGRGQNQQVGEVAVFTGEITLGQFLKWANLAASGAEAKMMIAGGQVEVNGRVETRRAYRLKPGDLVGMNGRLLRLVVPE